MIGKHDVKVRMTVDLIPEIEIIVYREGESPESALEEEEKEALRAEEALIEILDDEDYEKDTETEEAEEIEPAADADASDEDAEVETVEDELE
jgi:hypothetical protein